MIPGSKKVILPKYFPKTRMVDLLGFGKFMFLHSGKFFGKSNFPDCGKESAHYLPCYFVAVDMAVG